VRTLNLTRSVSFPSNHFKNAQLPPSEVQSLAPGAIACSEQMFEEKGSRCINYDKNTEVFNRLQQAIRAQSQQQAVKLAIEN
jgi:hypothetical protein